MSVGSGRVPPVLAEAHEDHRNHTFLYKDDLLRPGQRKWATTLERTAWEETRKDLYRQGFAEWTEDKKAEVMFARFTEALAKVRPQSLP